MLPTPEINFRRTPATLILAAVAVALEIVCTFDPPRRDFYYNEIGLGIPAILFTNSTGGISRSGNGKNSFGKAKVRP